MLQIKFRYADQMSNWEWREQECICSSIRECIEIYGLGIGCEYEILSVKEIEMDDKEIKDIYNYYGLGKKHEKEDFKNYVLCFINANIEVNNNFMKEIKKYDSIDTTLNIEKTEAENAILALLKDYIELY